MKEVSFRRCFVNGKKSGVASYDNGECRVLFFSTALGAGVGVDDLRDAGVSLHQFNNSVVVPSADAAGIQAVIPGAVVDWEGSKEFQARAAAAAGTRPGGGNNTGKKSDNAETVPAVPVVAGPDAFQVPSLESCPALFDLVKNMAPVVDSLNKWAASCSTALLSGVDAVTAPACIDQLAAFMPGVVDAFKAYETIIANAVNEYREKLAAAEAARVAAEKAAAAAAAAAANGKKLVTLPDGSTVEVAGGVHAEFGRVCQLLKRDRNVYLYGPAGTGKTYLCKQVADALGLPFFMTQKISNDFQLTGFVDASGKFQETALYQAATVGGVFMLDEFDASDECAGVVLNTIGANRYMDFPGVGRVECHKDFRIIACGNTIGRGADSDYTGRNPLDAATLDRFVTVPVGYDPEIELKKANGDKELVEFIHAVRAAVKTCGVSLVVSMRAIENIAAVCDYFPASECLEMGLLKGLEKDQIALIANECKGSNKWFKALKALAA